MNPEKLLKKDKEELVNLVMDLERQLYQERNESRLKIQELITKLEMCK
jgi:hypothetical protein